MHINIVSEEPAESLLCFITSETRRNSVEMHASAIRAFGLTLTFDLWPWKPFGNGHSHNEHGRF